MRASASETLSLSIEIGLTDDGGVGRKVFLCWTRVVSRVVSGLSEIIGVGKFYCEHVMNYALHLGRDL